MPEVRRTRATLRSAEFGFFGVVVYTRVHTPRRCGAPLSAGVAPLREFDWRPLRTNCSMVGKLNLSHSFDRLDSEPHGPVGATARGRPTQKPRPGGPHSQTAPSNGNDVGA